MKILLSNDDGVYAPGIQILKKELDDIATVIVVAPNTERSTTGHSLTLDGPIRLEKIKSDVYGCTGYPADCVLMGLNYILKDQTVDLVISGINRGPNLGQDVYYSGTVAAAREGAICGIPSIAISSAIKPFGKLNETDKYSYQAAANFLKKLLTQKAHHLIDSMTFLNINVPNLSDPEIKGVKYTSLGFREYSKEIEERKDSRNRPYYWLAGSFQRSEQTADTDNYAIENHYISIGILNILPKLSDSSNKWPSFINKTFN